MKNPDNKGQIGPMSLEDILPLTLAVIITFTFIAFTFQTTGDNLSHRREAATYEVGRNLLTVLSGNSVLVYAGNAGLLNVSALEKNTYGDLEELYSSPGYGFSIEVEDLSDSQRNWEYLAPDRKENRIIVSSQTAIRYPTGEKHIGILKVSVWKK